MNAVQASVSRFRRTIASKSNPDPFDLRPKATAGVTCWKDFSCPMTARNGESIWAILTSDGGMAHRPVFRAAMCFPQLIKKSDDFGQSGLRLAALSPSSRSSSQKMASSRSRRGFEPRFVCALKLWRRARLSRSRKKPTASARVAAAIMER